MCIRDRIVEGAFLGMFEDSEFSEVVIPFGSGLSLIHILTTPIGMALSEQLGGLPSITVVAIIVTGILGSIVGPFLYKLLKINDKVAMGIAMGNSSHAVGTARAMEIGETEGAMSSLTISISGIITVMLAPTLGDFFVKFIN